MIEELKDVEGGEHLALRYGDRFEGWYCFKTSLRQESISLGYADTDLSYRFTISDFNCRFIMPAQIEFLEGRISYGDAERQLGVFRFPRDDQGNFATPVSLQEAKTVQDLSRMTEEEIKRLMNRPVPLVFEAFRIPQFGFEYFALTDHDLKEIEKFTNITFVKSLKSKYDGAIEEKMGEIRGKIEALPNNLLILKNVLCQRWKNFDEVSEATNKIIHI